MSAEASFLQSREARRLAASSKYEEERKSRTGSRNAFWSALKSRLNQWNDRLLALETDGEKASSSSSSSMTEEAKRNLHMSLSKLQEELKYWKKLCLADSVFSREDASREDVGDDGYDDNLPSQCPPDLPLSDVRLLHTHFSECQTRLDQVRKSLLPRGKFIFQRYREALRQQERQQQQQSPQSVDNTVKSVVPAASLRHQYGDPGRTISNQKHVQLFVSSNGLVQIRSNHTNNDPTTVPPSQQQQQLTTPLSSLLLQNLDHCDIILDGSYQSLHLVSVSSSTLILNNNNKIGVVVVEGAIHVTDCHYTALWSRSQQLRLHESSYLQCHSQVSAGAILEDCREIVFYYYCQKTSDEKAMAIIADVKDFNWLKAGIPSPNFRMEQEEKESLSPLTFWQDQQLLRESQAAPAGQPAGSTRAEKDNDTFVSHPGDDNSAMAAVSSSTLVGVTSGMENKQDDNGGENDDDEL